MMFGPPGSWPEQDLIARSREFNPGMALEAYRCGVFPMPIDVLGRDMGWWSPKRRGVIEPAALRVSRSLVKSAKHYVTTVDAAFDLVLAA
jgi:leucyl/phenylalanyl-tRNA--protein transferase